MAAAVDCLFVALLQLLSIARAFYHDRELCEDKCSKQGGSPFRACTLVHRFWVCTDCQFTQSRFPSFGSCMQHCELPTRWWAKAACLHKPLQPWAGLSDSERESLIFCKWKCQLEPPDHVVTYLAALSGVVALICLCQTVSVLLHLCRRRPLDNRGQLHFCKHSKEFELGDKTYISYSESIHL